MITGFDRKVYKHFENLTDPRVERGFNHSLIEMIFVTLCAVICDANSWADVERFGNAKIGWFRKYIKLEFGVPSHDTFGRLFGRLDTAEFYNCLQSWVDELGACLRGETIAMDGKTLRGSFDKAAGKSAIHVVSAWAAGLRLCLGYTVVDDKSNEIPALQMLVKMINLEGSVVTADAMHCQKETAAAIINAKADYILAVKMNQPTLHFNLCQAFLDAEDREPVEKVLVRHSKQETNRDRVEKRETSAMLCPEDFPGLEDYAGLKSIVRIHRTRTLGEKTSEETAFFITSLEPKVRDLAHRVRTHWHTENQQHYVLDVTFTEDSSRIRKGSGPEISGAFRRIALNILQQDTTQKDSIRGKRKRCGWDENAFDKLLAAISRN